MIPAFISGTGACLPARVVDNAEIAARIGVDDAWIRQRTGIVRRHVASGDERTSTLAAEAGRRALADAGLAAADLDLIVVATVTPDQPLPATAVLVQAQIGARCPAFDVGAACAGFVYALALARGQIAAGLARHVLVIGAEVLTPWLDWRDRDTCILFGDGAGAVVVSAGEGDRPGIAAVRLGADGTAAGVLAVPGGGSARPPTPALLAESAHLLHMNGRQVYRHAVRRLPEVAREVLAMAGWRVADVDRVVPHQANGRVLEAVADRLDLPRDRLLLDIADHGNTSAASIPIAVDRAARDGRLQPGHRLLVLALGAGLVWGAAALHWTRGAG